MISNTTEFKNSESYQRLLKVLLGRKMIRLVSYQDESVTGTIYICMWWNILVVMNSNKFNQKKRWGRTDKGTK